MFRQLMAGIWILLFLVGWSGLAGAEFPAPATASGVPSSQLLPQSKAPAKSVAATVVPQGRISGLVADKAKKVAIAGASITATPLSSYGVCQSGSRSATSDLDGYYTIDGLADGPYLVKFSVYSELAEALGTAPLNFAPQWYRYVSDAAKSSPVQVVSSGSVPNVDGFLEAGGSLSGYVGDAEGALGFADVTAISDRGASFQTQTDLNGNYSLRGLASGSYTVSFKNKPLYLPEVPDWPPDFPSLPGFGTVQYMAAQYPSPVAVTAPGDTPDISMIFTPAQVGGRITGTMTSGTGITPNMVMVSVRAAGSSAVLASSMVFDGSGTFSVGGLASGSYDLVVNDIGSQNGFAARKISGVAVTAPNDTDSGELVLQLGGQIKGTVTSSAGGSPLENVSVAAHNGTELAGFAVTGADGTYTIQGLAAGSYHVQFSYCHNGSVEQWYSNKSSYATSAAVAVTPPQATSAINAVLNLAGANASPVASSRTVNVLVNAPRSLTLSARDGNADPVSYLLVSQPAHGTLSGAPPNLVYTPVQNFSGPDEFSFKANDGKSDSNLAAVSLSVGSASSAPVKGDVNGDGAIEVLDALLTLRYLVGLIPHTPDTDARYLLTADVAPLDTTTQMPKGDDAVDISDALMILKRMLNLEPWLPTGGGTTLALAAPQSGANDVPPGTAVQVSATKPLDPTTLTATSVVFQQFGRHGAVSVAGLASYDAARQELAFGATQLQADYLYNLVFSGLKDLGGFAVPTTGFSFTTRKNPFKRYLNRNPDGSVERYDDCKLNAAGDPTFCSYYTGPGADGVWLTQDDEVLSTEALSYDANGKRTRGVIYDAAGTDRAWFTADDHVLSYGAYSYDSSGRQTHYRKYYAPGADGIWFTPDDANGHNELNYYDSGSRLVRVAGYLGAGSDGVWLTADDVVSQYESNRYDALGRMSGKSYFSGAGYDAAWFTDDDTLMHYNKKVRDTQGQVVYEINFSSFDEAGVQPGLDVWSLGEVANYKQYIYAANGGRNTRILRFGHPGGDAIWNSADDVMFGYCGFSYDASGSKTGNSCYVGPGSNEVWFDADDVVVSNEEFTSNW